jgi:hypothetical protein
MGCDIKHNLIQQAKSFMLKNCMKINAKYWMRRNDIEKHAFLG